MRKISILIFFAFVASSFQLKCGPVKKGQKNVIVIMADDLAFHDLSFRGSLEIPTPNIDALAYNGMLLNRFYTPTLCSPSRAALLTGMYPHSIGMQNSVVHSDEPWGLDPNEKIMPQYFKEVGYSTHLIGKWHLGISRKEYLPPNRGYDTFFGYYGPYIDFFSYEHYMDHKNYSTGYDMRRDFKVAEDLRGKNIYATDLFTEEAVKIIKNHNKKKPLFLQVNHLAPHAANNSTTAANSIHNYIYDEMQALPEDVEKFTYIQKDPIFGDDYRRKLAAMMYRLDLGVGEVMKALKEADLLKDSILIFYSDNGGPTYGIHSTRSSNYPLRGQKESGWEGSIRCNAILYAPFLPKSVVKNEMIYLADLLPTLSKLANAGYKITKPIDGVDQSEILKKPFTVPIKKQPRNTVPVIGQGAWFYSSVIKDGFKYVNGSNWGGKYNDWLGFNDNVNVNADKYEEILKNSETWKAIDSTVNDKKIEKMKKNAKVICAYDTEVSKCDLLQAPCLYNIYDDPCEQNNLANDPAFAKKLQEMKDYHDEVAAKTVPTRRVEAEPRSDPINWDNNWTWYMDLLEGKSR